MTLTPHELGLMLATVAVQAPDLRAAGVTSVSLEGLSITLAAPEPAVDASKKGEADDFGEGDPLNDPATFGRRDGRVPGFRREPSMEES